jgi:flavin reductase (DIM6/NTAB) family NADH-FMN oxidoreductase RutF
MDAKKAEFDQKDFRNALGCFGTGVTVITTRDQDGKHYGVTASSFNSVSLDPPLILWSQGKGAPSHKVFKENSSFVVNVLSANQTEVSNQFARPSEDKFQGLDCTYTEDGIAILPGTSGHFECVTQNMIEGGDHIIFLAKVVNYKHHADTSPLFFWKGKYITP